MPFTKDFFKTLGESINTYLKRFPCGAVTVTIKANRQEYNVQSILQKDDDLLTFCHYDEEKTATFEWKKAKLHALPALTIPYELIESVEFNPAPPVSGKEVRGFTIEP